MQRIGNDPLGGAGVRDVEIGTVRREVAQHDTQIDGSSEHAGAEPTNSFRCHLRKVRWSDDGCLPDSETHDQPTGIELTKITFRGAAKYVSVDHESKLDQTDRKMMVPMIHTMHSSRVAQRRPSLSLIQNATSAPPIEPSWTMEVMLDRRLACAVASRLFDLSPNSATKLGCFTVVPMIPSSRPRAAPRRPVGS